MVSAPRNLEREIDDHAATCAVFRSTFVLLEVVHPPAYLWCMIDTLRFARHMTSAGLVREHAEAIAEGLAEEVREHYPSKSDLDRGLGEIRLEMQEFRTEMHKELGAMQREMRELAWKFAGLLVAQGAGIVALIKLFP